MTIPDDNILLTHLFRYATNIHASCTRQSKAGNLYITNCNTIYTEEILSYFGGSVLMNIISRNIRNGNTFKDFQL